MSHDVSSMQDSEDPVAETFPKKSVTDVKRVLCEEKRQRKEVIIVWDIENVAIPASEYDCFSANRWGWHMCESMPQRPAGACFLDRCISFFGSPATPVSRWSRRRVLSYRGLYLRHS